MPGKGVDAGGGRVQATNAEARENHTRRFEISIQGSEGSPRVEFGPRVLSSEVDETFLGAVDAVGEVPGLSLTRRPQNHEGLGREESSQIQGREKRDKDSTYSHPRCPSSLMA